MSDAKRSPGGFGAIRLEGGQLALSRARAALAAGRLDEAEDLAGGLLGLRSLLAARAGILLARLRWERGEPEEVPALLSKASEAIEQMQSGYREWLAASEGLADRAIDPRLGARVVANMEATLELARVWSRLGHPEEAKKAYFELLRESSTVNLSVPAARRVSALADYRLAELLVDDDPRGAYEHWRRAMNTGDEQVSPRAALRMATEVGGRLVTGRVERLFHHAMGSSDPRIVAEAALGLARHLEDKKQFGEADRYLAMVAEDESVPDCARVAERRRGELARAAEMDRLAPHTTGWEDKQGDDARTVIVVGAGTGGDYLLESLEGSGSYRVLGFVDDDASEAPTCGEKRYRILGRIDELKRVIEDVEPDEVLLAIPTLAGSRRQEVVSLCRLCHVPLRNLPRMHELGVGWTLADRHRLMTQLREVEPEELIGEERVEIDVPATAWLQYEKVVVVGAGALGAELCRRLADGDVGRLVVIDRRKSALRKITGELIDSRQFEHLEALAGDASDAGWLAEVFREFEPAAVFNTTGHSAAPACESSRPIKTPDGGRTVVRNEISVAAAVAGAAATARVPRMLHVSSRHEDRSGEPFDAMKALGEEIVLWHAQSNPAAVQAVVRVGQLLGSRNGRLARMKQQIRMGATVTIPQSGRDVRYLSTARWAELVLHAARLASNGDLIEPNAGEELDVRSLAEDAIKLRGWLPGEHVLIEESEKERWDDPVSVEESEELEDGPEGLCRLERPPASDGTLAEAFRTCAALVQEQADGGGDVIDVDRDAFVEIAGAAGGLALY